MKLRIDTKKLRKITPTENMFLSLADAIIGQQISTKAGAAIRAKFLLLFAKNKSRKKVTPEYFLTLSVSDLRGAGISPQKITYLTDLAEKFVDKTIDQKKIHKMTDDGVKEHLLRVKGIGPWTADMFLIFALNRPDILPVGDLGTKKGFQKAFQLKTLPTEKRMIELALPYAGKRTVLTLYLWHILDNE